MTNIKIKVRNPRTGKLDYTIAPPTPEWVGRECDRLRSGQREWQAGGVEQRIAVLQQWRAELESRRQELVRVLATDTGRWQMSEVELNATIACIDRWCELGPQLLSEPEAQPTEIAAIQRRSASVPYPLVGIIAPWNFPLYLSAIDAIPALLAGCAAIVKPSEMTPRFIEPMREAIAAVPALQEVLSYVVGAGDTGEAIIASVDALCFTGSVATGRKIAQSAAREFIPVFLELGGKDPAIVTDSADLDAATSALLWASMTNSGQSCLSIERIYVSEAVFEEFVAQLAQKAQKVKLAYPELKGGPIGPIIDPRQATIIAEHLQDAESQGAKVECGGHVEELGGGFWCRPTVLTQVNHGMKVMREETFGPIAPVMQFSSVEEAIALANDTEYGLSAAVFSGSEAEAIAIAHQIHAGGISINDAGLTSIVQDGEKNSFNLSGMGGSRMGNTGLTRFLRKQALLIKTELVPDPWWFPLSDED